jgi:cobalamin biosynthesis Mg chelatase CobN
VRGETVEELSQESGSNTQNVTANSAASTQVKASVDSGIGIRGGKQYVMVSIFKKSQSRNKRVNRAEGIIRLLLIILWAVVVVVLGFYSGFAYHHH